MGVVIKVKPGDLVRFDRSDGGTDTDYVRELFTQTAFLEPYARNQTFPAVVLTLYSWVRQDRILEVLNND